MSRSQLSVIFAALALLTGCGESLVGDWKGTAAMDGVPGEESYGVTVESDAKFQVRGALVDADQPDTRHALSGTRVGTVVALQWQVKDGDAVETSRLLGKADGQTIEGMVVCERQVGG